MKQQKQQYILLGCLAAVLLVIDQAVKIWVKTHMHLGEEIPLIGNWCLLHFVENEGFAFGMKIGGAIGKISLSLFRLVASGALLWYLLHRIRQGMRTSMMLCLTLVLVGAIGNLVDSCFYGLIFNESLYNVAQLFPPEGGYAPLLQGKVVDMFYFPLIDTVLPSWLPIWGGHRFLFFNAIFNVADACITVGAIWLVVELLFFSKKTENE